MEWRGRFSRCPNNRSGIVHLYLRSIFHLVYLQSRLSFLRSFLALFQCSACNDGTASSSPYSPQGLEARRFLCCTVDGPGSPDRRRHMWPGNNLRPCRIGWKVDHDVADGRTWHTSRRHVSRRHAGCPDGRRQRPVVPGLLRRLHDRLVGQDVARRKYPRLSLVLGTWLKCIRICDVGEIL